MSQSTILLPPSSSPSPSTVEPLPYLFVSKPLASQPIPKPPSPQAAGHGGGPLRQYGRSTSD